MFPPSAAFVDLASVVLRALDGTQPIRAIAVAYIDPIGGSLFVQAIIAGALGALATIKGARTTIKRFFRRIWRRPEE